MSKGRHCRPFVKEPPKSAPTGCEEISPFDEIKTGLAATLAKEEVFNVAHKTEIKEKYGSVFENIKCVFICLEGTLYTTGIDGAHTTEGAVEAFGTLKGSGLQVLMVTNTWQKSKTQMKEDLNSKGFPISDNELYTSSDCCKALMTRCELKCPFLLVADDVLNDFTEFDGDITNPLEFDSIVLGLPSTMIDYRLLTKTLSLLYDEKPLLVLHPGKTEVAEEGCNIITSGIYGQFLQFTTDATRYIPSKPSIGFYSEALAFAGVSPEECVIIGDNVLDDVRNPQEVCMKTILVRTGKYKPKDESKYCCVEPHLVVDNFAKAVKYILISTDKDPEKGDDMKSEAIKKKKWETEHNEFYKRLKAYAVDDCMRNASVCPPRVPSFIW